MVFNNKVFLLLLLPFLISAQYTDVINSNRPGVSVSAYAVGKNVVQAEFGLLYEMQDHAAINSESTLIGADISLRYGLLLEKLELNYEGSYISQDITFNTLNQLKNLIPAVSVYGGATFNLGENPFYREDATISYRGMVALQSALTPRLVLISNIAYDRITTDFPELSYTVSLSHAFKNPKWSVFVEHQGIDSDRYNDLLLRGGIAHLFSPNFQVDLNFGGSFKTTPSRLFASTGLAYRLDFHKDQPIKNKSDNTGKIKKNSMKKKRKKKKKNEFDF